MDTPLNSLPFRLSSSIENIYLPAGMSLTKTPKKEAENASYEAYAFALNDLPILFRVGKITPKRTGHFVAIYERIGSKIVPIDVKACGVAFLIVDVVDLQNEERGQFVFPQKTLVEKGVFTKGLSPKERMKRKRGKLSFRVFPPWSQPKLSAQKTEEWQRPFFFKIPQTDSPDYALLRCLFTGK